MKTLKFLKLFENFIILNFFFILKSYENFEFFGLFLKVFFLFYNFEIFGKF